jgi:hypothetical protein
MWKGICSRRRALQALMLSALLIVGCGEAKHPLKCYPVTGKVMIDNKPAVRAVVSFHPIAPHADGQTHSPSTFTDDNGEFKLTTFEAGDGAPVGEYVVTVVASYVIRNGQDVPVPDLLKGVYADPKKSKLRATVEPKEANVLATFELKAP